MASNAGWALAPLLFGLLLASCANDELPMTASWAMRDGTCAESGVTEVRLTLDVGETTEVAHPCEDGEAPGRIALGDFAPGVVMISSEGVGAQGLVVFRAETRVEVRVDPIDLQIVLEPVQVAE